MSEYVISERVDARMNAHTKRVHLYGLFGALAAAVVVGGMGLTVHQLGNMNKPADVANMAPDVYTFYQPPAMRTTPDNTHVAALTP